MRKIGFPALVSFFFASAAAISIVPGARAQNKTPTYRVEVVASRVWSNDDMDALRAKGLISTFDTSANAAPNAQTGQSVSSSDVSASREPLIRERDPQWYAQEAARLQAELENRQVALLKYAQALQEVKNPDLTASGIDLDKGNIGITPQAGIEILEANVTEVSKQLDGLADLARVNGISPGVLRG
jgi:hypothetical protein